MTDLVLSRRRFAQGLGIVVATFAWTARSSIGQAPSNLPFQSCATTVNSRAGYGSEPDKLRRHLHRQGRARSGHPPDGSRPDRRRGTRCRVRQDPNWYPLTPHAGQTSNTPSAASRSSKAVPPSARCWRRNPGDPSRGGSAPDSTFRIAQLKVMAGSVVAPDGRRATYWQIAARSLRCCAREIAANCRAETTGRLPDCRPVHQPHRSSCQIDRSRSPTFRT